MKSFQASNSTKWCFGPLLIFIATIGILLSLFQGLEIRNENLPNSSVGSKIEVDSKLGLTKTNAETQKTKVLPMVKNGEFAKGQLIVAFTEKSTLKDQERLFRKFKLNTPKPLSVLTNRSFLVSYESSVNPSILAREIVKNPSVEYAEPNYIIRSTGVPSAGQPNDPKYESDQWNLKAITSSEDNSFGVNAQGAWAQGVTGNRSKVYVAVLDTGIDIEHPDLRDNIWTNDASNVTTGIDGPSDPFRTQIHGWNFVNNNANVMPATEKETHGTHVAGTLGAVGNNNLGVTGVAQSVGIIPVKIFADESGTLAMAIAGIDYVTALRTKKGIPIVATNNSWTFKELYSEALRDAIRRGGDAGIIFVAAAGNDGLNSDSVFNYPTNYQCQTGLRPWNCVVSVAAITKGGDLATFSDYGKRSVTIGAPGENILSTLPGGLYGELSGTSMAAPHVTGAIALCLASNRSMSAPSIISALTSTSSPLSSLANKTSSGGMLNVSSLVALCTSKSQSFSSSPSDFISNAIYIDRIHLRWNAQTQGEYEQEIQIAQGPNGCAGTFTHYAFIGPGLNTYPVIGLQEAEFYCFRIRANRDSSQTGWTQSNLTITWTSNSPFIQGKAFMADGKTPVFNLKVKWKAITGYELLIAYTDYDGNYTLQVPSGTQGFLFIDQSGLETIRRGWIEITLRY